MVKYIIVYVDDLLSEKIISDNINEIIYDNTNNIKLVKTNEHNFNPIKKLDNNGLKILTYCDSHNIIEGIFKQDTNYNFLLKQKNYEEFQYILKDIYYHYYNPDELFWI